MISLTKIHSSESSYKPVNATNQNVKGIIQTVYNALFLGRANKRLQLMKKSFLGLGLTQRNCIEMSWIVSELYIANFMSNTRPDVLLQRKPPHLRNYFKAQSDSRKTNPRACSGRDLEMVFKRRFTMP